MARKKHKPTVEDILTFEDRALRYEKYAKSAQELRFVTGMEAVDSAIRGVAPGELMFIIAYSGTFKSAYLQNMLQARAKATLTHQMMFSMEMSGEKCFEREVQIGAGVCGWTVENAFKERSARTGELYRTTKAEGSSHLLVVDRPRLSLGQVADYVDLARSKFNEVGTVGIDYLGLMDADARNLFEKVGELSNGLKEMAKELSIPVVALAQVSRAYAQSKGLEIETDAAKGGGDIEAACDFMLGMYKSGEDLILRILKNRNGRTGDSFLVHIRPEALKFVGASPWTPPKKMAGGRSAEPF
jgi:replicative DNA helicase